MSHTKIPKSYNGNIRMLDFILLVLYRIYIIIDEVWRHKIKDPLLSCTFKSFYSNKKRLIKVFWQIQFYHILT